MRLSSYLFVDDFLVNIWEAADRRTDSTDDITAAASAPIPTTEL